MNSLAAVLALGFVLGIRHATDPDHVVAVGTIVTRHRSLRGAALIGAAWGIGHTLTVFVVGAAIILLGWSIPHRLGLSFEFAVGIMLVLLGLVNLRGIRGSLVARARGAHVHAHAHGEYVHTHAHTHAPEQHPHDATETPLARLDRRFGGLAPYALVRPLVVGMVHGLAGSAAVVLIVMAAIGTPSWALLYLLLFGAGTIAGMILVTSVAAWPLVAYPSAHVAQRIRVAAGLVSIAFGAFIVYHVAVVQGLLT